MGERGLACTNKTGTLIHWINELQRIAVKHFEFSETTMFDTDAWKVYYDDGFTPWNAMVEDLSNA